MRPQGDFCDDCCQIAITRHMNYKSSLICLFQSCLVSHLWSVTSVKRLDPSFIHKASRESVESYPSWSEIMKHNLQGSCLHKLKLLAEANSDSVLPMSQGDRQTWASGNTGSSTERKREGPRDTPGEEERDGVNCCFFLHIKRPWLWCNDTTLTLCLFLDRRLPHVNANCLSSMWSSVKT